MAVARTGTMEGRTSVVIDKREILDAAHRFSVNPHVIEKDYVLGWLLAGIFSNDELAKNWVFKGGTCLKKCYLETYRFSEDLDFTLKDPSHLDEEFLRRAFGETYKWISENSGPEFFAGSERFDVYRNSRGHPNCQAKLAYRGPVSPKSGGLPRVKLDLTADELLVLPPVKVPVFHPYGDGPERGFRILSYDREEMFAEKIRALVDRARPRDLYDVVNVYRNARGWPAVPRLLDILRPKCEFKGLKIPKDGDLNAFRTSFELLWEAMLAHQLPFVPPFDSFWDELPGFLRWLAGEKTRTNNRTRITEEGEAIVETRHGSVDISLGKTARTRLEMIRFAAANRLCVNLDYGGSTSRVEPYSLRRAENGEIALHVWNVDRNEHLGYPVDGIADARATNHVFQPRYEIEMTRMFASGAR